MTTRVRMTVYGAFVSVAIVAFVALQLRRSPDPVTERVFRAFEREAAAVVGAMRVAALSPASASEASLVPLLAASLRDVLLAAGDASGFEDGRDLSAAADSAAFRPTLRRFLRALDGASRVEDPELAARTLRASLPGLVNRYDRFSDLFLGTGPANLALLLRLSYPFTTGIDLVRDEGGRVEIDLVVRGSEAWAAGLVPGDEVLRIDGRPVGRLSLSDLRDAARRPIEVEARRGEDAEPFRVSLGADGSNLLRVESAALPGGVVWIRVPIFFLGASVQVADALRERRAAGARAVVLDLRGNPGGTVADAVVMADFFVGAGPTLARFEGESEFPEARAIRERRFAGTASEADFDGPVVVLVDRSSASASELLAMALRDAGRARIVGERTFGKGVAQIFFPLVVPSDPVAPAPAVPVVDVLAVTALRFVSARTGESPHGLGLVPDLAAATAPPPEADVRAFRAAQEAVDAYLDSAIGVASGLGESLARGDGRDPGRYPGLLEAMAAFGAPDAESARRWARSRLRARRLLLGLDAGPDLLEDDALRSAAREALRALGLEDGAIDALDPGYRSR